MARTSSRKLTPEHTKKLYRQYTKVVAQLNHSGISEFFDELLGEEEKEMLAKRFAAIVMLLEHNSTYRTAQLLHMSPSTVERLRKKLDNDEYTYIEQYFKKHKEAYEAFWKTLETVLRAGMPPLGRGRWKSTFEILGRQ